MASTFFPVMNLPQQIRVFDLSQGKDPHRYPGEWGIGKYAEHRPNMYTSELFKGVRDYHIGIDISAPPNTPIFAFDDLEIFKFANNSIEGDYGFTIITKSMLNQRPLYALFGHLSAKSIHGLFVGKKIPRGDEFAWVGTPQENGGWPNPHLHFQISHQAPETCDMPGVVSKEDFPKALEVYPDPRIILGNIY